MTELWFLGGALLLVVPAMYVVIKDGIEATWRSRIAALEDLGKAAQVAAESLKRFAETMNQFSRATGRNFGNE